MKTTLKVDLTYLLEDAIDEIEISKCKLEDMTREELYNFAAESVADLNEYITKDCVSALHLELNNMKLAIINGVKT